MRSARGWPIPTSTFPICCCSSRAGIASCSKCAGSAITAASRRPSTMPPAKPSTRPPSCSASAYPGGPAIEELAKSGDPAAVPLPRPLVGSGEPHFSFAGLKSAVQRAVASGDFRPRGHRRELSAGGRRLPGRPDAAGARQERCAGAGRRRRSRGEPGDPRCARRARDGDRAAASASRPRWLCTDNAAMIAWAGAERFAAGTSDPLDVPARARWPLDERAEKVRGAGVKA